MRDVENQKQATTATLPPPSEEPQVEMAPGPSVKGIKSFLRLGRPALKPTSDPPSTRRRQAAS